MSIIKRIFLVICCFCQVFFSQAQSKTYSEIKTVFFSSSSDYVREMSFSAYLNHVHPIEFNLKVNDQDEVVGLVKYGDGKHQDMLEGFFFEENLRLESINSNDEFTGLYTAKLEGEKWIDWLWLNADGSLAYRLDLKSGKNYLLKSTTYWDKKNQVFLNETSDTEERKINVGFGNEPNYQFKSNGVFSQDCAEYIRIHSEAHPLELCSKKSKRIKINKGKKQFSLKKKSELAYYCHREISPYTMSNLCVPKLNIPAFDQQLKELLGKTFYASPCDEQSFDPQFHWNNIKKITAKIHYHDKDMLSFRLRLINTCTDQDEMIYFNFDKRKGKWLSDEEIWKKLQSYKTKVPLKPGQHYLIGPFGIEVHQDYDLVSGSNAFVLSYEQLGIKNYAELIR